MLIKHEAKRSERLCEVWEQQVDHPLMHGSLNLMQITLACASVSKLGIPTSTGGRGIPSSPPGSTTLASALHSQRPRQRAFRPARMACTMDRLPLGVAL
jgi:hypothetical protein